MIPLAFCGFLCLGLVLTMLGANQDYLATDLELDLVRTAWLASALALGLLVGTLGAGPLYDRLPRKPLFVASILMPASVLFGFGSDLGFREALFRFAWIGLGAGAYDTLFIAAIAERFGARSAKPMSLLHTGTATGAIIGPLLVAAIATRWHWALSFQLIGIVHIALAAAAMWLRFPAPPPRARPAKAERHSALSLAIAPFVIVAFAYLGLETAMSVFAIPFASDGLGLEVIRGRAAISSMWFGLLAGRLGAFALRGNLDGRVLIAAGIFCCAAISIGAATGMRQIELLYFCVGLSLGPVFPVTIALAGQRFPNALGSVVSLAVGVGSIGCFAVPWLTGALGDQIGIAAAVRWLAGWAIIVALGGFAILRGRARAHAEWTP
ncbi:MAG: MFS transporter [Deltaproteobacteria bacterium]|jgi:MFS family permease|nr:MFS transporter [Deltaproteobacteria bacterium]